MHYSAPKNINESKSFVNKKPILFFMLHLHETKVCMYNYYRDL